MQTANILQCRILALYFEMKTKFSINLFILFSIVISFCGCDVKDYFTDYCYKPYLLCVAKSVDADEFFHPELFDPNDMTLMLEPQETLIYVFSKDMIFLGSHRAKVGEIISLPYEKYDQIYTVAVGMGSTKDIDNSFTPLEVGKKYAIADQLFALTILSGNNQTANSPIDFMYADDTFPINPYNDKNVVYYLNLEPRIGAVKIVTHNLTKWADARYGESGLSNDVFTFKTGTTLDQYNLGGELYGSYVSYQPSVNYPNGADIITPMFNMMPTTKGKGMQLYIYRNGTLIYPTNDLPEAIYTVPARAPYIIELDFDNIEPFFGIIPAGFNDIYVRVEFK